jgi:hypothetical protein
MILILFIGVGIIKTVTDNLQSLLANLEGNNGPDSRLGALYLVEGLLGL